MPPSINDKFGKASISNNYAIATTVKTTRAAGVTVLEAFDLSKYAPDTPVFFVTYKKTTDPVTNITSVTNLVSWKGLVNTSANTLTNLTVAPGYTDLGNAVGDFVECIPTSFWSNSLVEGLFVGHNPDGSFKASAIRAALDLDSSPVNGWELLGATVTGVTYNGNNNYDIAVSADPRNFITTGMRLRTQRTVAAQSQVATFSGTQSWTKTGAIGLGQTDDITAMAQVKLSEYTSGAIISQRSGSNGWDLLVQGNGSVRMHGVLSAGNHKLWYTTTSLPINRRVHVAGTMDMSGNLCAIYFDGILQPILSSHSGTAGSITPSTTLNIGNDYGGSLFKGQISNPGIFSAILPETTIRNYASQKLTAGLPSLVYATTFDGVATDLTVNGNHLTAVAGATYVAGSPFGNQGDDTVSTLYDYAIVQKAPTATVVNVQVPEGCAIPTSGGITALHYSTMKTPYNFPLEEYRWTLHYCWQGATLSTANGGVWTPLTGVTIVVPLGKWVQDSSVVLASNSSGGGSFLTLSQWDTNTPTINNPDQAYHRQDTMGGAYVVRHTRHYFPGRTFAAATTLRLYTLTQGGSGTQEAYLEASRTHNLYFKNAYL